ncbi:hypothetical protein Tco_0612590 [Tanacetum coccineum]
MEITVVTLVEEQMSLWKGNFPSGTGRVGCKLNGMEAKVDDYDELGDSMTRWKDVAWFWLSRECDEDGKDLESKIDDVMVTRRLQGSDGATCNCTLPTQEMRSIISTVSISPEVVVVTIIGVVVVVAIIGVVVVVMIIGVVGVVVVSSIIKLSFVIIGFKAVTFPSILMGNPLMKASISFSVFGTIFGHKTANSWNLLA